MVLLSTTFAAAVAGCGGGDDHPILPPGGTDARFADGPTNTDGATPDGPPTDATTVPTDGGDGRGPRIAVITPLPGTMASGVITLTVEITDPDGVDEPSIKATFADVEVTGIRPSGTNQWSAQIDTRAFSGLVFPTIVVRAKDRPGIESRFGWEITLDNEAPIASLDPPRIREAKLDGRVVCAESIDPVGEDAAADGSVQFQLIELRARIEDLSNLGTSTTNVFVPYAGIKAGSVQLFVLDDTSRPLVVDSDGDHLCDLVNPQLVPTTIPNAPNEAAVLDLVALPSNGGSNFTNQMPPGDEFRGENVSDCALVTEPAEQPDPLCAAADDNTRIPVTVVGGIPMIYTIPPIPPEQPLACMGFAFDVRARHIADGWACAAVRFEDNLGNHRVSPPLRICIDADGSIPGGPCASPGPRPDCSGTYDPASGTVTSTPCTLTGRTYAPRPMGGYAVHRIDL